MLNLAVGPPVNVSALADCQAEVTIAIDPTLTTSLFEAAVAWGTPTGTGIFAAFSTQGVAPGPKRIMATGVAGGDSLPTAYDDPQAAFDQFHNLFLVYATPPSQVLQSGRSSGNNTPTTLRDVTRTWVANI